MSKIIVVIILLFTFNRLSAQYVHYSNKSKPITISPLQQKKPVVYHDWPDKCPGMSGSIPVLTSYVPKELVLKLTEIYKGHLYAINSLKVAGNKTEYKLKVCVKGQFVFEYADEEGNIIRK